MQDIKRLIEILLLWFCSTWDYFYQGVRNRRFLSHAKIYFKEFFLHLEIFSKLIQESKEFEELHSSKIHRLKAAAEGLHHFLPENQHYFYSLLMLIDQPPLSDLKASLDAALNLSAPHYEILLGLKGEPCQEVAELIEKFKNQFPHRLKLFPYQVSLSSYAVLNDLVTHAQGNYLFILPPGDWIRPDLLYRYEQTLRFFPYDANRVLFCDEYELRPDCCPVPRTRTSKPERPIFPYVFNDSLSRTLLISKSLWSKMETTDSQTEAFPFDLPLRLAAQGAFFEKVPLHLYGVQGSNKIALEQLYSSAEMFPKIVRAYQQYAKKHQLEWHWEKGYSKNSIRALPIIKTIPQVHAVILYKDQHNLTLSAVKHLLNQVGVEVKITAVDNNSHDLSIAEKLLQMGVEVISIQEPFNFSKLNNRAVQQTKIGQTCEYILFLNNDVELDSQALLEMCRWINQPGIGLVGCRLNYPNGRLQHGGVIIESSRAAFIKSWHHEERTEKFKRLEKTNFLRICPAVTAACCLIKRQTFLDINGFDEVWFPVAFSDTALAVKIRAKGLHCFYTPFAFGVHHESISRKKVNIEDFESLSWTHRKFVQNLWKNEKVYFDDLINSDY